MPVVAERPLRRRLWVGRLAVTLIVVSVFLATDAIGAGTPICVIDMGSNSFRRIVGSFDQGRYTQHAIEKRTLGVGDDVEKHGRISDPKLNEIRQALAGFTASCQKERITSVRAVGTAAFRDAANGTAVVTMATALGIQMEIATEKRESELAYLAGSLGQDGYAVIDNGSRSIELVARNNAAPRYRVFNLGYRVAYERFFANANDPLRATRAFADRLRAEAIQAPFMKGRKKLVGVEFGEMIDVLFPGPIEGRVLTRDELGRRLRGITNGTPEEFRTLKRTTDIDRALPRLVAAATLMDAFGYAQIELTERELGVGLIIEAGL